MNQSDNSCYSKNNHCYSTKKCNCENICYKNLVGIPGPTGPQGDAGGVLNYADFYALMPPDNAAIVETSVINSTLTVQNPADNATALTITPLAGGTQPVSAHLVIIQIQ